MKQIQLLLLSILLFACSSEHNNEFYLRKSNKELSLLLDSNIKSNTKALFLYKVYIPDQSVPLILEQTVPVFRTKQNR